MKDRKVKTEENAETLVALRLAELARLLGKNGNPDTRIAAAKWEKVLLQTVENGGELPANLFKKAA